MMTTCWTGAGWWTAVVILLFQLLMYKSRITGGRSVLLETPGPACTEGPAGRGKLTSVNFGVTPVMEPRMERDNSDLELMLPHSSCNTSLPYLGSMALPRAVQPSQAHVHVITRASACNTRESKCFTPCAKPQAFGKKGNKERWSLCFSCWFSNWLVLSSVYVLKR